MILVCLTYFLLLNSFLNTTSVVMCLGITVAVCLLVIGFSFQTKVRKITLSVLSILSGTV